MTVHASSGLLALGQGQRHSTRQPSRWTLATSLGLHLLLLAVVTIIRLPHIAERPAASYQVSLVTLRPVTAKASVVPSPVLPQESLREDPMPPPAKIALPAPSTAADAPKAVSMAKLPPVPGPVARKPSQAGQNLMKDVLRGIELPPEAPRPMEAPTTSAAITDKATRNPRDIENMINKLTVPDIPLQTPATPMRDPVPEPMTRRTVLEELERLERQLQAVQTPVPVVPPPVAKAVESPPPASRTTSMRIEGVAAGSNSYFSRIQGLVSRFWAPPKVDLAGREPKVVIKFRLHRSGAVSDVGIELSSGNDYYDAAGKRAILSAAAAQFPPFPNGLTQAYVDINFSFGVEPAG